MMRTFVGLWLCVVLIWTPAGADDERTPEETVDAFHHALESDDAALALSLLTRNVIVFEMGAIDSSRDAYASSHLLRDLVNAAHTRRRLLSRRGGGGGDRRWVVSVYRVSYKSGSLPDLVSTETAILRRTGGSWRITHFHWSAGPPGQP